MITGLDRAFIRGSVTGVVDMIRRQNSTAVPGEIYDAIAQELERRCREVIGEPFDNGQVEEL